MMWYKNWLIFFSILLLTACETTPELMWMHQDSEAPATLTKASVSDLYRTPASDAEIAAAVQDFRVLVFSDPSVPLPGIPNRYKPAKVKDKCGMRVLPNSGTTTSATIAETQRQIFLNYATTYNEIIIAKCEKMLGKIKK